MRFTMVFATEGWRHFQHGEIHLSLSGQLLESRMGRRTGAFGSPQIRPSRSSAGTEAPAIQAGTKAEG
jgi:hypothetical protein